MKRIIDIATYRPVSRLLFSATKGSLRSFSASPAVEASEKTFGFIGLGNMGSHMARHLRERSGNDVLCYDISADAVREAASFGCTPAANVNEVASNCQTLITMLPNSSDVAEVLGGANGAIKSVASGTLIVDCSTVDPSTSQAMAEQAEARGASFYDAPVSGGVVGAQKATLTFIVGGPQRRFSELERQLLFMGARVFHAGTSVGMGEAAKICNNMLLAIEMIGLAETLNLGQRLGVDPKTLTAIINTSTGRCWSSDTYNPVPGLIDGLPSGRDYEGGFLVRLIAKDLGLAQAAATATSSPVPLGAAAHQIYRLLASKGLNEKDFAVIYRYLQERC